MWASPLRPGYCCHSAAGCAQGVGGYYTRDPIHWEWLDVVSVCCSSGWVVMCCCVLVMDGCHGGPALPAALGLSAPALLGLMRPSRTNRRHAAMPGCLHPVCLSPAYMLPPQVHSTALCMANTVLCSVRQDTAGQHWELRAHVSTPCCCPMCHATCCQSAGRRSAQRMLFCAVSLCARPCLLCVARPTVRTGSRTLPCTTHDPPPP